MISPKKVSPHLNNTWSPGSRVLNIEFNLPIDLHGVEELLACELLYESLPVEEEK
jgi:hypothetical protein